MAEHRELPETEAHTVYRKIFADETARLADTGPYSADEINIKAIQVDTAREYRLTSIAPSWTAVGLDAGRTRKFYVDLNTPAPLADQDGSILAPYASIQVAANALPAPLGTNADLQNPLIIFISSGEYDEDLTIDISGRQLWLSPWGAASGWKLGTFNGIGGAPSGTLRNLTIVGSHEVTDFVRPALRITAPGTTSSSSSASTARISGALTDTTVITGTSGSLSLVPQIYVDGDVTLASTTTVTFSDSHFGGDLTGTGNWNFRNCFILGDVNVGNVGRCFESLIFSNNWTVADAPFSTSDGFVNTLFIAGTVFTGPAGSFRADGFSTQAAKNAGVTFAGGVTLDLTDGQQYQDNGTPVPRAITTNFTGDGKTITLPAAPFDAMVVNIPVGVQGGAIPSVVNRVTRSLATIADGAGITEQIAGITTDHITANAGYLMIGVQLMTSYSGGQLRQEQYTALLRFSAGAGDPGTRLADFTETNMLSDGVGFTSIEAGVSGLIGVTGILEMTFDDAAGGNGTAETLVVAVVSEYYET